MTNKKTAVLRKFKELIKALSGIEYVGWYPENIDRIGSNFPCVLIKEGDESLAEVQENLALRRVFMVHLYLYHNIAVKQIIDIPTRQAEIEDAILDDVTLGGTADCSDWVSAEKGDWTDTFDPHTAGYSDNMSLRIITFEVILKDAR